jgi:hypothetical protein
MMAATLTGLLAGPAGAQGTVWTAIIPQGFPHNIYVWHLKPDGSYKEDGRNATNNAAIQPTLTGHWRMTGKHMVLRQDGIDYVFDGNVMGDEYLGVLYLDGKRFARFCAVRKTTPPQTCADISA